ncbi:PilZ domain-containing protein, partial [Azoarcus taiwanensis]|nr:PilZ domain-containing protein [Azoarcus taiwanensis]
FEPLEPAAIERLEDWLAAHVLMNASVPINERDAARIVTGPSLI